MSFLGKEALDIGNGFILKPGWKMVEKNENYTVLRGVVVDTNKDKQFMSDVEVYEDIIIEISKENLLKRLIMDEYNILLVDGEIKEELYSLVNWLVQRNCLEDKGSIEIIKENESFCICLIYCECCGIYTIEMRY